MALIKRMLDHKKLDPGAFEIAFQAVPASQDALPDEGDPELLCRRCGGPAAFFPERGA